MQPPLGSGPTSAAGSSCWAPVESRDNGAAKPEVWELGVSPSWVDRMGERALVTLRLSGRNDRQNPSVSTNAFEAKLVGMGEDVAFDMFVEPDAAAGLGHANRSLVLDHLLQSSSASRVTAGARTPAQMVTSARRHRGGSGRPHAISV